MIIGIKKTTLKYGPYYMARNTVPLDGNSVAQKCWVLKWWRTLKFRSASDSHINTGVCFKISKTLTWSHQVKKYLKSFNMKIILLFMVFPLAVCHDTRLRMDAFRIMFGQLNNRILASTHLTMVPPQSQPNRRSSFNQRRAIKHFMRYLERKIEEYL